MRKLAEDNDNMSLYIDSENIITFNDCTDNDSYNVFDMFFNAIKAGFNIEFRPTYYYGYYDKDAPAIITVSKDGFCSNHAISSNTSDKKAIILEISEFIKSATDEINKKIDEE